MIRNKAQLARALSAGITVAVFLDGGRRRFAVSDTGESVNRTALKAAIKRGELKVISTDLDGEPMQFAAA